MHQFRFSKSERIKSKKIFKRTLTFGKKISSKSQKLRCSFIIENIDSESQKSNYIQVAFAISRKSGEAVWRNKLKRILREIYRLNKYLLIDSLKSNSKKLYFIIYSFKLNQKINQHLRYRDLESDVIDIFETIKKEIEKG